MDTLWATFGDNWATFHSNIWSHGPIPLIILIFTTAWFCVNFFRLSHLPPAHSTANSVHKQCDQIGRFLILLATNLLTYKSSPKRLLTLWLYWKRFINVKTAVDFILATFRNMWATFLIQHLVTLFTSFQGFLCQSNNNASPVNLKKINNPLYHSLFWLTTSVPRFGYLLSFGTKYNYKIT